MFELGARPYPPRDLYLAYLRQSDVFIGIYGEEYGWVAPGSDVSGLEDEYRSASGKPRLVYVQSPAPSRDQRLVEMLGRVEQGGVSYRPFAKAGDLVGLVADDLAVLVSERFGAPAQPPVNADPTGQTAAGGATVHRGLDGGEIRTGGRFIGRRRELTALRKLLVKPRTRLVTLIGPGGVGKTRLAMETVATVAPDFATIAAAEFDRISGAKPQFTSAVASALGVAETTGASLLDSVVGHVGSRKILLLLDGFEQVIDAAPVVAQLVARTSNLRMLVTSRERLNLTGERVIDVPPLAVPTVSDPAAAARRSDSVQLFAERAAASGAELRLDADELRAVREICVRLDGLPLAIELAASRLRMLDVNELARRLDRSLPTLTDGARDLPPRQRAMRSTIGWSYDLLDEPDRRLFTRLGVFTGSFALDAAEAICGGPAVPSLFDGVASLVDKALVRPDHSVSGQPRFTLLQVIREFAAERLAGFGEADRLRRAHADFYRRLVIEAVPRLRSGDMRSVLEQHIADQANIHEAMQWFLDTGDGGAAAAMGCAMWPLWFAQGQYTEGLETMERVLAANASLTDDDRANAGLALGMMVFERGDYERAPTILRPAYDEYVSRGDEHGATTASVALAVMDELRHPGAGEGVLRHAIDVYRRLNDRWGLALTLLALGWVRVHRHAEADAIAPLEECEHIVRDADEDIFLSNALISLGWAHLGQGDIASARGPLDESLKRASALDNRETFARALDANAAMAQRVGDAGRGAILLGAADGMRRSVGADVWAIDRQSHAETTDGLRALLGEHAFQRDAERGANLAVEEILEVASGR
jgi:predicted ATPase